MERYRVIGLMSGSSLDGLDIAYCEFAKQKGKWNFKILEAITLPYPEHFLPGLKDLTFISSKSLWETHTALGKFFGMVAKVFIEKYLPKSKVDFIASHGHTVFHFPEKRFTTQIGDGAAIAAASGLPVVCDFRTSDIAHGGQGTPIVPIGDKHLFPQYLFCLNIGGIANISCKTRPPNLPKGEERKQIVAFDICAANQVLNALAAKLGKEYDTGGKIAAAGSINKELLRELNKLKYFSRTYPKSLDNSFSREQVLPVLEKSGISTEDKIRTSVEHIAMQVARHVQMIAKKEKIKLRGSEQILVTGGGAFNKFLVERIAALTKLNVVVPGDDIVKFKEALVIAFMGVLRMRGEINVLKSVTGASKDTVGGAVHLS